MCVILDIEKGVTIPPDMLETACDINKHGYGIAYVHKGRIKIDRKIRQKNDFKEVQADLDKLKDRRVHLHLRHATVGAVTLTNAHPFITLQKDIDGLDMAMMHNGTLWEFSPPHGDTSGKSDTLLFNQQFLTPLARRFVKYSGDKLLEDTFFQQLVKKSSGLMSVLVIFDNLGNVLRVNGDKGKQFDGYWASNDYSFDVKHARSSKKPDNSFLHYPPWDDNEVLPYYGHNHGGNSSTGQTKSFQEVFDLVEQKNKPVTLAGDREIWAEWERYEQQKTDLITEQETLQAEKKTTLLLPPPKKVDAKAETTRFKYEISKVKEALQGAWKVTEKSIVQETRNIIVKLDKDRKSFCDLVGVKNLKDVLSLSKENFIDLCSNYPMAMAELFIDMSAEVGRAQEITAFMDKKK